MPSLRKKVAGFIRQLSANHHAEVVSDENNSAASGCFIHRYLNGAEVGGGAAAPPIVHGRSPQELPRKPLGRFAATGAGSVLAAATGPSDGLAAVNKRQRHLSTSDPDVDYIDMQHRQAEQLDRMAATAASSDCVFSRGHGRWFTISRAGGVPAPIDNTVMRIRAAGSVFSVGRESSRDDLTTADFSTHAVEDNRRSRSFSTHHAQRAGDLLKRSAEDVSLSRDRNSNLSAMRGVGDGVAAFNLAAFDSDCDDDDEEEDEDGDFSVEEDFVIPPPAEYASPVPDAPDNFTPLRKSKSAPAPFHKKALKLSAARQKIDNAGRMEEVAGVRDWQQPHAHAYGAATTLYERQPVTQEHAGNPIADCFAVVARQDSAILVLADGVNWGEKACIAARSAVHGCVEHLNKALFASATPPITNTMEVFIALLRSFHAAHSLILQEEGMLTTLTTAVVLPLATADKYVVCVCNVGDSLAYVYSRQHGVREVTKGSHDIHCMRDMRDALGALGPVDGQNPELNNLTCSMTELEASDIVFITSDGISDNFDPVVGKFAVLPPAGSPTGSLRPAHKPPTAAGSANNNANKAAGRAGKQHSNINKGKMNAMDFSFTNTLPTVQAYQRHELSLLRMDDLLKNGVSGEGPPCSSARSLCDLLLDFATRLTAAKRRILEDTDLYYAAGEGEGGLVELSRAEQRARRRKVLDKLAMVPGKLDHASVVAYTAGFGCATRETNL